MQLQLITNNPSVVNHYPDLALNVQNSYLDVLIAVRDLVHQGNVLLTHPETGSITANKTPYRSVLLEMKQESSLDYDSLQLIEHAIKRFLLHTKQCTGWDISYLQESILADYQLIDFDIISHSIKKLRNSV